MQFVQVQLVQLASSQSGPHPHVQFWQSTMHDCSSATRGARVAAAPAPNARSKAAATAFGIAAWYASTARRHFSCASSTVASHPGHSSTREPL